MSRVMRGFWIVAASAAVGLLAVKLVLFVTVGFSATRLGVAAGVVALLYALFLLEGLQVAGLQLRESALPETLRHIDVRAFQPKTRTRLATLATLFEQRFDAFVTGRQILVITTVVTMAALLRTTAVPAEAVAAAVGQRLRAATDVLMPLLNAPLFAFVTATLVPAWISQLLPQFLADRRAFANSMRSGGLPSTASPSRCRRRPWRACRRGSTRQGQRAPSRPGPACRCRRRSRPARPTRSTR